MATASTGKAPHRICLKRASVRGRSRSLARSFLRSSGCHGKTPATQINGGGFPLLMASIVLNRKGEKSGKRIEELEKDKQPEKQSARPERRCLSDLTGVHILIVAQSHRLLSQTRRTKTLSERQQHRHYEPHTANTFLRQALCGWQLQPRPSSMLSHIA